MASLVYTIRETLRYRGAIGQWSWVLHRLTGLGVVLFLFLHVIDTSWATWNPEGYVKAVAAYQSPLFTVGEFGLIFAVVYHALNGLRISIMDFKPELWKYQRQAAFYVLGGTVLILVPVFILMSQHVWNHYYVDQAPFLGIGEVLVEQLPFALYFLVGAIAALLIAAIHHAISKGDDDGRVNVGKNSGSGIEKFWWSFMRVSGLLIIPLVFGHLAMMHVLQGVFDLTLAGSPIVGMPIIENVDPDDALIYIEDVEISVNVKPEDDAEAVVSEEGTRVTTVIIPNGINDSGTSVEFVVERWNYLVGGVAIWKWYDVALLALVVMHGFNGLRYVLTDYTMENAFARRAMIWLTIVGGISLFAIGAYALIVSVENETILRAIEASRDLYQH